MPEHNKKTMDELGRPDPVLALDIAKNKIVVILDDIRSMHNVGSVFRTCDAFGIQELFLCGYTPQPPHRDIHKTALGATDTVKWRHFDQVMEAVSYAREIGCVIWAVEQAHNSVNLANFVPTSHPIALVFGNEVLGVSQDIINLADGCIEIPQWGAKHSLNISVSAGVVLWEMVRLPAGSIK